MTLLELQQILGEEIRGMKDGTADEGRAKTIAIMAKQMINNADVVLRADKYLKSDGHRTDYIVGDNK